MNYNKLIKYLKNGREIEFTFNELNCSMTNFNNEWYFSINGNDENKSFVLSDFEDYDTLIESINKIVIEGKSIKEIFDNRKYDENSLSIF